LRFQDLGTYKAACKMLVISPIFYEHTFQTKEFYAAFCIQFGFVFFWPKEIEAKCDHKMLLNLTTSINFPTFFKAEFHT
jgi:hypothetical protein